jgi:hypothetical protein
MKYFLLIILSVVIQLNCFSQFYKDDKGKVISYNSLPDDDDLIGQYMNVDVVYKTYHDTSHHFTIEIPDSFLVRKTSSKNLVIFRMPILQTVYDYISVTSFSKNEFASLDSFVYNKLLKNKPGEYLNGNNQAVFRSATLIDNNTYKVELECGGSGCTQQWRFTKNDFGYYVIMLAAKKETYDQRVNDFNKFSKECVKINL